MYYLLIVRVRTKYTASLWIDKNRKFKNEMPTKLPNYN